MDDKIALIIKKHYPEIANGWHVPVWANVTNINENVNEGDVSDRFRPRYAVSAKLLDRTGKETGLVMENIALTGSFGFSGGGMVQFPQEGAIVELSFAFGQVDKPYISNVLPFGLSLPECKPGEINIQSRTGSKIHFNDSGNITQQTDHKLKQVANELEQITGKQVLDMLSRTSKVKSHAKEEVGGTFDLSALGALILQTAGHAELSSLESLNLTTASDLNENIAGKRQTVVKELLSILVDDKSKLQIDKNGFEATVDGGYVYLGTQSVDVVKCLYDLCDAVSQIAQSLAMHTHPTSVGPTSMPIQSSDFAGQGSQVEAIAKQVQQVVK